MRAFEPLCPAPPDWRVAWDDIRAAFSWIRDLEGVEQDPLHHAEGDVATHTRMACESLASLEEWRSRPPGERVRLFAAVLLHDVAKPFCTREDADGRITAHGHSRRGDLMARRILWELGAPRTWREHVAGLIRHHQVPFWALERPDLQPIVFRSSLVARNDDLALLATADILGRVCSDTEAVLESIALFREFCEEQRCLSSPRTFASDHARFEYFRTPGRDPDYAAYDDTTFAVTVMSGFPGVGKDRWIAENRPGLPVVSLDALRASMGASATKKQGAVVAAARSLAREHLRARRAFVWNATNISRQLRSQIVDLAANYGARIEIVALECSPSELRRRNAARPDAVPAAVVERLIGKWEAPDDTEAHRIVRNVS